MVIIKMQSIVSDLAVHFGFPSSQHAEFVSSSSPYINDELFSYWIESILVPEIVKQHRDLQIPDDAKTLLILDECLAHSEKKLQGLQEHGIEYHFLPPHLSHITQPLD